MDVVSFLARRTRAREHYDLRRSMALQEARGLATTELHRMFGALGITQCRVAGWFGVAPRSIRRWKCGDRRTPRGVDIVLRLLAAGMVTVDQVEQVAFPIPARTNGCAPPVKPPREAAAPLASLAPPARINGAEPESFAPLEEASEHTKTAAIAILALSSNGCRWPIGDPQSANFCFCSNPVITPPYCAGHRAQAYLSLSEARPGFRCSPPAPAASSPLARVNAPGGRLWLAHA